MNGILRIGTRGSALALVQARAAAALLEAAHSGLQTQIVEIRTSGDWVPAQGETRLSEAEGGKGLFAREIENALLAGQVDCGVHSAKDMASVLPAGLVIDHILPREDSRDVLLSRNAGTLDDLPEGAVVGTSSLRRQAFLLARRPDLRIVPLRGNVPTRIEKMKSGQVDATILALAGLRRLGLTDEIGAVLEPDIMLPAAGQGAVGIETRHDDASTRALLDAVHCRISGLCVTAERAALAVLDGSCRTPVGAHAVLDGESLTVRVIVAAPDGQALYEDAETGPAPESAQAAALGHAVGARLKARVPAALLAA